MNHDEIIENLSHMQMPTQTQTQFQIQLQTQIQIQTIPKFRFNLREVIIGILETMWDKKKGQFNLLRLKF